MANPSITCNQNTLYHMLTKKESFLGILSAILYSIIYDMVYHDFTFAFFEYMGVEYVQMNTFTYLWYIVLSLIISAVATLGVAKYY